MVVIKEIISMVIMSLKLDFHSELRAGEKYIHWEFVRSPWDPLKSAHVCWVLSEPPLSVLRNTWRSSFHLATITLGGVFIRWQKSKYFTLTIIISLSLFNFLIFQVCHEENTWRSSIHVPTILVGTFSCCKKNLKLLLSVQFGRQKSVVAKFSQLEIAWKTQTTFSLKQTNGK